MDRSLKLQRATDQRGLTLFELLVVLTILALLATLVAPRIVGYLGRAKSDVARSQTANIAASLELFYIDMGRYPTVDEGLSALVEAPEEIVDQWLGPYFKEEAGLVDPWGRAYLYEPDEGLDAFTVTTYGRDGEEGGEREDADIRKR